MSEPPAYHILPLSPSVHDRAGFECGEAALDRYLRQQASQDIKRRIAGCWVIVSQGSPKSVLGFYTLSTEVVDFKELGDADPDAAQRLPRYPRLGAVLLGRLAVAKTAQKQDLGELLLFDAMHRILNTQIPAALMITDPKDVNAAAFYRRYGFKPLNPERLFLTTRQLQVILGKRD